MTGGDLAAVLVPVVIAIGGGGWKIGGGLLAMATTVEKMGIEMKAFHGRLERVETTLDRIAPPTVPQHDLGPSSI